jgi:hypothetical protein
MDSSEPVNRLERRAQLLFEQGATVKQAAELLDYTPVLDASRVTLPRQIPLPDEPHLEAWQQYAIEAEESGVFPVLQKRLIQLQFPIGAGISSSEAYQAAIRYGKYTAAKEPTGIELQHPDRLQLRLHQSLAGTIPVLLPHGRHDFVSLVQAFGKKNEPEPIPEAMGACIIAGYLNWDRIHKLRQDWEATQSQSVFLDIYWQQELREHILPHKSLYLDTFIILSDGSYSGIPAAALNLPAETWHQASQTIRLEHECTHYLTRRLLSTVRNHLLDELVADLRGIVAANGRYCADWFLHFLGLEAWPQVHPAGRLELYRGTPPLSDEAFLILQRLVKRAAANVEAFFNRQTARWQKPNMQVRLVLALSCLTIEELAASESHEYIEHALNSIQIES